MAIVLSDLRSAVSTYVSTQVTTTVSALTADVPAAISPGEEFTFGVTVANASGASAIRLVNVVYHLSCTPGTIVQLKVPASPPARASSDPTSATLAVGSFVSAMYLFPTDNSLSVGDSDTISNLKGKGIALGAGSITCHVHADADLNDLFPKGTASVNSAPRPVNVV